MRCVGESVWITSNASVSRVLRRVRRANDFVFCAPGGGGAAGGFRRGDEWGRRCSDDALHDASVDFTSADEEAAAIDRAKAARAKPWRAEDEKETETEENELLDRLEGGDASRAAGAADVDAAAAMDKPGASRRRAADTLVCRGAIAVSGLLNVLVEAEGGDPGCSDSTARGDVPTLLAPVAVRSRTGARVSAKLWLLGRTRRRLDARRKSRDFIHSQDRPRPRRRFARRTRRRRRETS